MSDLIFVCDDIWFMLMSFSYHLQWRPNIYDGVWKTKHLIYDLWWCMRTGYNIQSYNLNNKILRPCQCLVERCFVLLLADATLWLMPPSPQKLAMVDSFRMLTLARCLDLQLELCRGCFGQLIDLCTQFLNKKGNIFELRFMGRLHVCITWSQATSTIMALVVTKLTSTSSSTKESLQATRIR